MDSPVSVRCAVLQALRVRQRSYGGELITLVREATAGRVRLSDSTVYPALKDLERLGLVEEVLGVPSPDKRGRPARVYSLTALGQVAAVDEARALLNLLGVPDTHLQARG